MPYRGCCYRHLWPRLQIEDACTAQTVCLAFCMPLTIGLVMLLVWNVYLALHNKTTIEFHEGVTANIKVCDLAWTQLSCQCWAYGDSALCTAAYSVHLQADSEYTPANF